MASAAPPLYELRTTWTLRPLARTAGVLAFAAVAVVAGVVDGKWWLVLFGGLGVGAAFLMVRDECRSHVVLALDAYGVTFPVPQGTPPRVIPWSEVEAFVCHPADSGDHRVGVVATQAWRDANPPVRLTAVAPGSCQARFEERIDAAAGAPVVHTSQLWHGPPRKLRELAQAVRTFAPHLGFTHRPHGLCRIDVRP
ncbi:hypothetical protein [Yinghuangia soli]|uniref:Uncharacterized protein n=1 Tax=Yinghuangia soli TaxID=2908204 RepID=A0AA41Q622_9ACTN|nr:hypothetical protein [Yinghuangia soli]MCF2532234.1 hypothetical protein [Yinghuangia soli]